MTTNFENQNRELTGEELSLRAEIEQEFAAEDNAPSAEDLERALSGEDPEVALSFIKIFVLYSKNNVVIPADIMEYVIEVFSRIADPDDNRTADQCLGLKQSRRGKPRLTIDQRLQNYHDAEAVAFLHYDDGLTLDDAIFTVAEKYLSEDGEIPDARIRKVWSDYQDHFKFLKSNK